MSVRSVMVAAGGIFTEIYRDRSLRLAPVDLETAREMIAEVRGLSVLTGFRGKPPGDLAALAQAIAALSHLADDPAVTEAEINPLLVRAARRGRRRGGRRGPLGCAGGKGGTLSESILIAAWTRQFQ